MLFDSPEILAVCKKYAQAAIYEIPSIVRLATDEKYEGERRYLAALYNEMHPLKRKTWFHRFTSDNRDQFWGAWFELMLFGWLKPLGNVHQESGDGEPDLVLSLGLNKEILLEAKAILEPKSDWIEEKYVARVFTLLREIEKPYAVRIASFIMATNGAFDEKKFIKDIDNWLSSTPEKEYVWSDKHGNSIVFVFVSKIPINRVNGARWSDLPRNVDVLKTALAKKAKQHKAKRNAEMPYVICLFLQSYSYLPRNVVEAWLGNSVFKVNTTTGEFIHTSDSTGIHYLGEKIVHTTVSGTLVFLQKYDEKNKKRDFDVHWIENPFADDNVKLDPNLFPLDNSFVVKDRGIDYVNMHWLRDV